MTLPSSRAANIRSNHSWLSTAPGAFSAASVGVPPRLLGESCVATPTAAPTPRASVILPSALSQNVMVIMAGRQAPLEDYVKRLSKRGDFEESQIR